MRTKTVLAKAFYISILSLPLIITGCGNSEEETTSPLHTMEQKTGNQAVFSDSLQIEMEIPAKMRATTQLNSALPFQYEYGEDEIYIVGNREDKEIARLTLAYMDKFDKSVSMTENYLNLSIDQMKESGSKITIVEKPTEIKAKNASGMIMQVDGIVPNIQSPIAYWYACYEYKGKMYKFIFWTLQSRKAEMRSTAMKAFKSIRFK